jgi:dihydroorotase
MSHDWLIKNTELVNEGRRCHADLRVKGAQVIDASSLWLASDR